MIDHNRFMAALRGGIAWQPCPAEHCDGQLRAQPDDSPNGQPTAAPWPHYITQCDRCRLIFDAPHGRTLPPSATPVLDTAPRPLAIVPTEPAPCEVCGHTCRVRTVGRHAHPACVLRAVVAAESRPR